jgi:hypothetical protein
MDFPKFDGSNPQEWLRMTKKYFDMVFVPEDAKFDYAQMYITGKADTWLRNSGVLEENLSWNQFCDALLTRFSTNSSYDVVDEFNSIKQGSSTVSEYTDRFEEKMADYRKENPEVKDHYYIKCYVNGLHEEIRHHLKSFEPKTLYQAVEHARNMEKSVNAALYTADASSRLLNILNPATLPNNSQNTNLLVILQAPRRNQKNHLF